MLPGDARYGDPLSTAGDESPQVLGRRLAQLTDKRPGVMREAGMSALQMWQAVSEAQGRGGGGTELAVVFTRLSSFSDWALEAGGGAGPPAFAGRGRGDTELAIVFTDLSSFSDWALEAGDEQALELLRDVGEAIEPPVVEHGGRVVKRLGDGMMAVFPDPAEALEAVKKGRANLQ